MLFGLSALLLVLFATTRRSLRNAAAEGPAMQDGGIEAKYSGSEPLFGPANEGAKMSQPADRLAELYEDPDKK